MKMGRRMDKKKQCGDEQAAQTLFWPVAWSFMTLTVITVP
jgi:hypothetical protein